MSLFGFGAKLPRPLLLVVDDEADIRGMIRHYLEGEGYGIVEAENGQAALEAARRHAPDLILMDAAMPGMDGWAACASLANDPKAKGIPILMCTARKKLGDVEKSFALGVRDFIAKPLDLDRLAEKVKRALAGHDMSRED